jgi:hypothetical protein
MSDAKHTPGPWKASADMVQHGCCWDVAITAIAPPDHAMYGREKIVIAECNNEDARLICAAPDLLAALEALLRFAENTESELGIVLGSANSARAAIAKARGKP